jgi:hypothetical protein
MCCVQVPKRTESESEARVMIRLTSAIVAGSPFSLDDCSVSM